MATQITETNYMLFRSAGKTLALRADLTRQVVPLEQMYHLPAVSGALLGLIPAAGRALPIVDLAALAGLNPAAPAEAPTLALVCDIAGEQIGLPVDHVIGFVSDEDAPRSAELLSPEVLIGGYFGGGQKGQVLNLQTLLAEVQQRFISF